MTIRIFLIAILLLSLLQSFQCQSTILTYIIQHEISQKDDYMQVTLTILIQGKQLTTALTQAQIAINNIKSISTQHCESKATTTSLKQDCKDIVEVSKYTIEPKYHLVRKIPTFTLFIITYEVSIKIKNINGFGKLIDRFLKEGGTYVTLHQFTWKAENELDPEIETLREGIQEGKQLCAKMMMDQMTLIEVKELTAPQEEEEEVQEPIDEKDTDLAEDDSELVVFKFKVKCESPSKKKKK